MFFAKILEFPAEANFRQINAQTCLRIPLTFTQNSPFFNFAEWFWLFSLVFEFFKNFIWHVLNQACIGVGLIWFGWVRFGLACIGYSKDIFQFCVQNTFLNKYFFLNILWWRIIKSFEYFYCCLAITDSFFWAFWTLRRFQHF